MGRQIKMSIAEARAAGLVDPIVKGLAGTSSAPEPAPGKKKRRKKRSLQSSPAIHPNAGSGPQGVGDLVFGPEGDVIEAQFRFDVVPVPKERAKIVQDPSSDRTFGFTPSRTLHFHKTIKTVITSVFGKHPAITGPVGLDMTFVIAIPSSWPKWKQAAARDGLITPTGRPDLDNLEKALLDAFNGVVMIDDAYVVERTAKKIYGDVPAIHAVTRQLPRLDIHARRADAEALRAALDEKDEHDC